MFLIFSDQCWNKLIKYFCEWSSPVKLLHYGSFTADGRFTFACDDISSETSEKFQLQILLETHSLHSAADVPINNDGTCFWVNLCFSLRSKWNYSLHANWCFGMLHCRPVISSCAWQNCYLTTCLDCHASQWRFPLWILFLSKMHKSFPRFYC